MYQSQVWARGDFLDRIQSDFDVSLAAPPEIVFFVTFYFTLKRRRVWKS
jgi:hypothetical protein